MFEVKLSGAGGRDVKERVPHPVRYGAQLTGEAVAHLRTTLGQAFRQDLPAGMQPTLSTTYRRTTFVSRNGECRLTCDVDLVCRNGRYEVRDTGTHVLVESKSAGRGSAPDRILRELGVRPAKVSKYCVAVAALHPELPSNPWHQTLQRYFGPRSSATAAPRRERSAAMRTTVTDGDGARALATSCAAGVCAAPPRRRTPGDGEAAAVGDAHPGARADTAAPAPWSWSSARREAGDEDSGPGLDANGVEDDSSLTAVGWDGRTAVTSSTRPGYPARSGPPQGDLRRRANDNGEGSDPRDVQPLADRLGIPAVTTYGRATRDAHRARPVPAGATLISCSTRVPSMAEEFAGPPRPAHRVPTSGTT